MDVFRLALEMAENGCHIIPEAPNQQHPPNKEPNGADGPGSLSESQREVLDRCLHALTHAKNDSHILAALLLVNKSLSNFPLTTKLCFMLVVND